MAAAYLTGGQGEEAAGDTSHSISIDSGATGSDRLIEITLVGRVDPCTLSSVQYGGVAMTSVADVGPYLKSYRLVAPANGANNLTFTSSAFDRFQYAFKVLTGVDQTTPLGTPVTVTSTATGDRSTGSVTCPAGGMVIGSLRDVYSPTNPATAASGGGTLIGYHRNGNDTITAHSYRSDTGALAWTTDNLGFDWAAIGIPVNASSSATVDQEGARFGYDDGSESAHTWAAAQGSNLTAPLAQNVLVRALLQAAGDPASAAPTLRYQKNGSGGFVAVPVGATQTFGIPTWQSSATPASGTGSVTWPLPSSFAAGDLLIWVAESANQAIPTAPTGATEVSSSPQGTGTAAGTAATRITVYAKIATGSETTNSAGDAGDHTLVSSFAIRGAHQTLASALHVVAGDVASSASASVTCPGGTTTVANCLIVNIVANATDTTTAQGSGWANSNLGSVTEQLDFGTASGNGGGITVITGTLATAGSIGGTTGTLATSSVQGRITLAIRPPADITNEVYVSASSNIASGGEATTQRLTGGTGTFLTGRRWDDENGADALDLAADQNTEVEWCLQAQAPAVAGDYFDLRVYAGGTALSTYTVTPRWTIGTPSTPSLPPMQNLFARMPALRMR